MAALILAEQLLSFLPLLSLTSGDPKPKGLDQMIYKRAAHVEKKKQVTGTPPMVRETAGAPTGPPPSPAATAMETLDRPLHALGFEYTLISPQKVTGQLTVTKSCCQPFGVLHGGVTALMAEAVASMGAYAASGFQRVAGVQLSVSHLKAALVGDLVVVEAVPTHMGRMIQVWEVQLWRIGSSTSENKVLLSTSKVTLVCNLIASKDMKGYEETVRKYARL